MSTFCPVCGTTHDGTPECWLKLRAALAEAHQERDNWIETARMHAKNETYYRELIVSALAHVPAAYVSDDGSVQQDVLCAKLPELFLAAEARAAEMEKALEPFVDPDSYSTADDSCRRNKAMDWCAVHSFRWPCPVGRARAALASGRRAKEAGE